MNKENGAILLLSGPSGCGKSSLLKELYKNIDDYYFSISTTTRDIRDGEKDGVDYYFVSKEQFEQDIEEGNFLEWAKVHDNYYGTSLKPINQALEYGKLVIFDIDVQGFEQVIKLLRDITTTVFITTPSLKILQERLENRATDTKETIERRLKNAKDEIEYIDKYDYIIINDDLTIAANQLLSVATAARIKSSLYDHKELIKNWYN